MIILQDEDVRGLSWEEVLGALEAAFREPERFKTPERTVLKAPGEGSLLAMPCADEAGWFGVKQVSVLPRNAARGKPTVQAWYTLFDPEGTPALACGATLLTRVRTAGASALAARYLVPQNARTLLVIGTGALAPWMAEAHAQVRAYAQVKVWGRNPEKAAATAADIGGRLGGDIKVAEDLERAVLESDVITAATTARTPVVKGAWLRAGHHVDLVGAFSPQMAEGDAEAVKRADVFVDDRAACETEAGDLIQAQAQGWSFDGVYGDLHELVTGEAGRENPMRITLFKSVGLGLEDLAVAKLLLTGSATGKNVRGDHQGGF